MQCSGKDGIMWFILVLAIFISVYALSIANLDIFRLGYILHIALVRNLFMSTHFWPMRPFYILLKTPGNQKAFGVFGEYKIGTMTRNGLIKSLIPRWGDAQKIFISMLLHETWWDRGWGLRKRGLKIRWKFISRKEILMKH